ncbi:hypothetical protein GQ607_005658 [Colletotrichum asianum]|uniref:Ankyrin repeat protein n=1 Tax=Colletotrichum asianum TaxID=702518 RepID=A0A8H3ZWR0_9PEZI|nr:hypothetical protein GQ607_005658 [Colletotrichum asianum]
MTGTLNTDLTHTHPETTETQLKVNNVADEAELAIKELNASLFSAASMLGPASRTSPAQDFDPSTERDLPLEKNFDRAVDDLNDLHFIGSRSEEEYRKVMEWNESCSIDDAQSSADSTMHFENGSTSATSEHGRTSPTSDATSAIGYIEVHDVDQQQVDIVKKMMAEEKYRDAVQYLKDTFRRDRKRSKCLPQPLLQHFAKAICDAELYGTEAEKACEIAPDVGPLLDAARLEKANNLLNCGEFRRINLLLQPYGVVSAHEQEHGFQLNSVQMELRHIRCLTLVRFGASNDALGILGMLLRSKGLSEVQRGQANYYAAEAYFLKASSDIDLFEENLEMAKKFGSSAYNLLKHPLEAVSNDLMGCISLMVEINSAICHDSEVKRWKGRLAKVQRKCMKSQPISPQPKPFAAHSDATQRFSEFLKNVVKQGKSDIETTADLVIGYLEQNYEVDALCPKWYDTTRDAPPLVCFGCIRNSVVKLIKHGSILPSPSNIEHLCSEHQKTENWQDFHGFDKPPEALLGPRHKSDSYRKDRETERFVPCFNLLSFFAIADPMPSEAPAESVSGCVGEIKALFEFTNLDHEGIREVVNTAVAVPVPGNSTSSDKAMNILRTPVWLAACFGQKQVVKYLLSLGVVNNNQFSYEGLLQYPPCYPQGMAITSKINDSLLALVDTITESQAAHLLGVAHTLWSWDRLPVFDALLSKAGSKSLNSQLIMKVPYLEEKKWVVRCVNMQLVHCLVQFWINTPIQPGRVLPVLKRHGANFCVKDNGRAAIDIACLLAETHCQRYDPPAGRLTKKKPPPVTAGNAQWHRRTL